MPSHPLSARKTREAARNAVLATNAQNEALHKIAAHVDREFGDVRDQITKLQVDADLFASSRIAHKDLWFSRGFVGRLKFLVLGR